VHAITKTTTAEVRSAAGPQRRIAEHRAHQRPEADRPPRISVVIPTLNEEAHLARALEIVQSRNVWEIIVVDGGSNDSTVPIAKAFGTSVLQTGKGRALQMNAGADQATGDILLFLHADTLLPKRFDENIIACLQPSKVSLGAFQLCIDTPGRAYRFIEKCVECRSKMFKRPYGDQAMFIRRKTFDSLGGYPDMPVLEDYELVRRARKIGKIRISEACVVTSGRRWRATGVWKTTFLNQLIIAAYRFGVSIDRIAAWREK